MKREGAPRKSGGDDVTAPGRKGVSLFLHLHLGRHPTHKLLNTSQQLDPETWSIYTCFAGFSSMMLWPEGWVHISPAASIDISSRTSRKCADGCQLADMRDVPEMRLVRRALEVSFYDLFAEARSGYNMFIS